MYYCNTKVSLRTGGRKAPKGGVDRLKQLIPDLKSGESYELYKYLLENKSKGVEKDLSKYEVDFENIGDIKLGTTKSGIDYLTLWVGGDWESPVQIFLYWDGKQYRGYIPLKGNAINTVNKSAFGNDEDEDEAYLKKEFKLKEYTGEEVDEIEINFDMCLEDFESRLEVI